MTDAFDGACLKKLARAKHHLDLLNETIKPFLQPKADALIRDENTDGTYCQYRLNLGGELPDIRWSIGDFIHNAHAALDYWAWSAVARTGTMPTKAGDINRIQFPIYADVGRYRSDLDRRLPGVPSNIRTEVERLQPWYGGKDPTADPLLWLYELSIYDKHRSPPVSWLTSDPGDSSHPSRIDVDPKGFGIEVGIWSGDIKDGAVIAWARGTNLPKVNVSVGYGIRIGIDKVGRIGKELALGCLGDMYSVVARGLETLVPLL